MSTIIYLLSLSSPDTILIFVFSALKPALFSCFGRVCRTFNSLKGLILESLLDLQLFPLNSRSFISPYVAMVCEGQICLYNIFTTFVIYFCVSHYLKIHVVLAVQHFCCCKVYNTFFLVQLPRSKALNISLTTISAPVSER